MFNDKMKKIAEEILAQQSFTTEEKSLMKLTKKELHAKLKGSPKYSVNPSSPKEVMVLMITNRFPENKKSKDSNGKSLEKESSKELKKKKKKI